MNSTDLLKKFLELLNTFSKKLPEGLVNVNADIEKRRFQNCDALHENILKLSEDLKELSEQKNLDQTPVMDLDNVQITVTKAKLDQRINAFISHVQNSVDQQNILEFFPAVASETLHEGCARTNAVYRRRPTRGNHVQVNRVKNKDGPQTLVNSQGRWLAVKREKTLVPIECPESVQERLANLESHLRINKNTAPKDVYARLKLLEDKVLELESISPEYFSEKSEHRNSSDVTSHTSDTQPVSIDQIDDKIRFLKHKLLSKKRKIG